MTPGSMMDRALGAYLGFAVGDALGATVEFMTAGEIAARHGSHCRIIGGGWLKLNPGQVTDDTEMALCVGQAIIDADGWDVHAVCEAFSQWLRGVPADVGNTCRRGIRRYIHDGYRDHAVQRRRRGKRGLHAQSGRCPGDTRRSGSISILDPGAMSHDAQSSAVGRRRRWRSDAWCRNW